MLLCLPRGGRVQQLGHSSSATAVLTVGRFSRRMRSAPRRVSHQAADAATSGSCHYGGNRPFSSFRCEALMGSSLACRHRISVLVMITRNCWCIADKLTVTRTFVNNQMRWIPEPTATCEGVYTPESVFRIGKKANVLQPHLGSTAQGTGPAVARAGEGAVTRSLDRRSWPRGTGEAHVGGRPRHTKTPQKAHEYRQSSRGLV